MLGHTFFFFFFAFLTTIQCAKPAKSYWLTKQGFACAWPGPKEKDQIGGGGIFTNKVAIGPSAHTYAIAGYRTISSHICNTRLSDHQRTHMTKAGYCICVQLHHRAESIP
jgi:hypothetical protein